MVREAAQEIGAFVPGPRVRIEGKTGGPLSGLTFAVKDLFDVAGVPSKAFSPRMPSETSSVIVLPTSVAPASSSVCTAQEWRSGTARPVGQS